jgi:hypothetical protein
MDAIVCLTLMWCYSFDVRNCMMIMVAECCSVELCRSQLLILFPEFRHLLTCYVCLLVLQLQKHYEIQFYLLTRNLFLARHCVVLCTDNCKQT